jgi:NAD(P)-dependent dehydrogenase (short-subunit alcohol dehydrogenase family)
VARSAGFADFAARVRRVLAETWQADCLDALVHNAGIGINAPFAATTEAQFDELVAIHLKAPFFLSQHLLPLLRDGGSIIHLSSGLTRFTQPGYAAYAAMKGGVEVLTRYLARELGARGIRVNTVAPGRSPPIWRRPCATMQMGAALASQTALGRVGQPDDIGPVMAALPQPGMAGCRASASRPGRHVSLKAPGGPSAQLARHHGQQHDGGCCGDVAEPGHQPQRPGLHLQRRPQRQRQQHPAGRAQAPCAGGWQFLAEQVAWWRSMARARQAKAPRASS